MATRLFGHYHPKKTRASSKRRARFADDLPPPPPEIIRAEDEPIGAPLDGAGGSTVGGGAAAKNIPTESDSEEDDTLPYDGSQNQPDDAHEQTPPPQDQETEKVDLTAIIQKTVDSAVGNAIADAMQPVIEELNVHRQKTLESEAKNRALRSQLGTLHGRA